MVNNIYDNQSVANKEGHKFQREVRDYLENYFKILQYNSIGHPDILIEILNKKIGIECKLHLHPSILPKKTDQKQTYLKYFSIFSMCS